MAEPVLLISSDPFLGSNLEAVAHGRVQIAHLDPAHRPSTWPAAPSATVVLDVTPHQRTSVHSWVRHHHPGPLVILLKPGEHSPALPADHAQVVVGRPFRLIDLVALLDTPWEPEEEADEAIGPQAVGRDPATSPGSPVVQESVRHPHPAEPGSLQEEREEERHPHPADGDPLQQDQETEHHPHPADDGPLGQDQEGERHPHPADGGPPLGRVADPGKVFARLSTAPLRLRERRRVPAPAVPGPPPSAAGPRPHGPLPRPDWPTAATQLEVRRRRAGWRGRGIATRVLLGVVVALAVGGGWLALGLVEARQDLLVGAAGVRDELARAEAALSAGRPDEAGAAVQAAERSLQVAAAVPERRELRVAARLPVLSGGIADTRRLLAAAGGLTGAGKRAVAVAPHLRAGPAALLRGDHFDLDALDDATAQAKGLVAELEAARAELQEVRGGPLAPGVDEARRWALGRLDEALGRARPLVATLDALPAALGVGEPRRYLVVLTGPAGRRPSGGAPLAVREVVLDEGVVDLRPGDGELAEALRDTRASANFRTTGRAWLQAAQARGRGRLDGVIALDPVAMRMLLEATGPVAVPGYGRIDAAAAVAQLTRDASRNYHEAVLGTLVARFLSGNDLIATGRVLGAAGAGGNVRAYAADPGLQRMLTGHRLDGTG